MAAATRLIVLMILLSTSDAIRAQAPTAQPSSSQQADSNETSQARFSRLAINGAVFIYRTAPDPCAPMPPPTVLLPLGSGFVVGIASTDATPQQWNGWKFLVTAKHVLANQNSVIVRVNAVKGPMFICKTLDLHSSGAETNEVLGPDGVDLVALALPNIDGADPTVVPIELLLDESQMKTLNIGPGTQVVTVGYLFGYSGEKANFPVIKFGHVSAVSDESWFYDASTGLSEQGYVVDLPNAPGLSGAPVFSYGVDFDMTAGFRYRELPPYVVGVVKDLLLAPVGQQQIMISQGVAVIEPGPNLKVLMKKVSDELKAGGGKVKDVH
jgi:hypothetical protein